MEYEYKKLEYEDIDFSKFPDTLILNDLYLEYEIKVSTKLAMRSKTIANMVLLIGDNNDTVPIFMINMTEENAKMFMNIAKEFYDKYYENITMSTEEFYKLIKENNISFEDLCLFVEFANFANFPELYNAYIEHFAYLIKNDEILIN